MQRINLPLEVEIIHTEDGFDNLEQAWNELLSHPEVDAHLFQSYEWQRVWWDHFGDDHELLIQAVWKGDNLVGIAPLFIASTTLLGLYEYRKLKFIGSTIPDRKADGIFTGYSISDYLDVIIHPDHHEKVGDAIVEHLDSCRRKVDKIELDEVPESGPFMEYVLPKIWKRGWDFGRAECSKSTQLQLPDSIDECLDQMHSKARSELRYAHRAVTQKEKFQIHNIEGEDELVSNFETFVNLHQKRWNQLGYSGVFINNDYEHFLKEVSRAFINHDHLIMNTATDNEGNCIAVDLAFRFRDRIYNYQKAFDAESTLAKYSPGKALTYSLIQDGIEDNIECLDLLRGAEKYKVRMTNQITRNWKMTIPGEGQASSPQKYIHKGVAFWEKLSNKVRHEWLLVKVHIDQWGIKGFLPQYYGFLKYRISEKFTTN